MQRLSTLSACMLLVASCLILVATACIGSVQPFYTEHDLVREPALLGVWHDDSSRSAAMVTQADSNGYTVDYVDDDGTTTRFSGHLARFAGLLLLDLKPSDDSPVSSAGSYLPLHSFYLVDFDRQRVVLRSFDPDTLAKYLEQNPAAIANGTGNDDHTFTAPTRELQAFLSMYAKRPNVYASPKTWRRTEYYQACEDVVGDDVEIQSVPWGQDTKMAGLVWHLRLQDDSSIVIQQRHELDAETVTGNWSQLAPGHLQSPVGVLTPGVPLAIARGADERHRTEFRLGSSTGGSRSVTITHCTDSLPSTRPPRVLAAPALMFPAEDSTFSGNPRQIRYIWSSVRGATAYQIEVADCPVTVPETCHPRTYAVADTTIALDGVYGAVRIWRVRAYGPGTGLGTYSASRRLRQLP